MLNNYYFVKILINFFNYLNIIFAIHFFILSVADFLFLFRKTLNFR